MADSSEKKFYRVLHLDDCDSDHELIHATLIKDGLPCDFVHVKGRQQFEAALAQQTFDLIISDFTLPGYDGIAALALAKQTQVKVPFIFVSGTIGEDRAVESLKCGATDYVLKDSPERLVSTVKRALRESQDRAECVRLEGDLRQAQKMEAIGQLAGGVAHDFNNLLAAIRLNVELASLNAEKLAPNIRDHLAQINAAAERAAALTRQLLVFSRKQAMHSHPINLAEVIADLAKMLRRIIGENISFLCLPGRHSAFVHADVGMVEQVVLNLVVNARDAMPKGGDLVVSTKKLRLTAGCIPPKEEAKPGNYVCLRVRDGGCGISAENLPRIFEPFFTTKEPGKGTGLGLATVYGIVKQHGGWIRVSSRVGNGTIFRIFLPAIETPPIPTATSQSEASRWRGNETILLVEDDNAVRHPTRQLLENYGYTVIEAASASEAMELWRTTGKIDVLLTDVIMPGGTTGHELAEKLRKLNPTLKVVFVSGYNLSVAVTDTSFFRREHNHFLQKPFHPRLLPETVRRCLDEKPELTK